MATSATPGTGRPSGRRARNRSVPRRHPRCPRVQQLRHLQIHPGHPQSHPLGRLPQHAPEPLRELPQGRTGRCREPGLDVPGLDDPHVPEAYAQPGRGSGPPQRRRDRRLRDPQTLVGRAAEQEHPPRRQLPPYRLCPSVLVFSRHMPSLPHPGGGGP
ncbi:hypothetical protein GCM10020000_62510 [Streptomyces olivoverticillatus]